jgi:phage FluMu protein Com
MRITCPKCKEVQSADEKTATCPSCRTVLRRCADCAHYDVRVSLCKAVNRPIAPGESHYPTYASASTYCRSYAPANPPPA